MHRSTTYKTNADSDMKASYRHYSNGGSDINDERGEKCAMIVAEKCKAEQMTGDGS